MGPKKHIAGALAGGAGRNLSGDSLGWIRQGAAAPLATVGLALLLSVPAKAAGLASDKESEIQTVVVTAQRRSESLQSVPISVQVIDGQTMAEQNLNSLENLAQTVPSVHVGAVGRMTEMYVRGIGSGQNQSFDQSVAMFTDDIYHGRSRMGISTFLDLERAEVLKGPQSTFFGNNAIAGAFNLVTAKPSRDFDASARALYGKYGQYAYEGMINGALGETTSMRLAAIVNGQDGWVSNINTGQKMPMEDNVAVRGTLLFKPSANLDATLKLEGSNNKNTGGLINTLVDRCPPPAPFTLSGACAQRTALGLPTGFTNNNASMNAGQIIKLDTTEGVLTVNYRWGGNTLTSVTGLSNYRFGMNFDLDLTPVKYRTAQVGENYRQFSQEFRIASALGQPIETMAGIYFQSDHLGSTANINLFDVSSFFQNTLFPNVPPFVPLLPYLPFGQAANFTQDERVTSVFGSATWNATDKLKLTGGLRGSWVKKDMDRDFFYGTATQEYGGDVRVPAAQLGAMSMLFAPDAASDTRKMSRTDQSWMPSLNVKYALTPATMAYASAQKGFKAGGLNGSDTTGNPANLVFAPEKVNAYEAGLKSQWKDFLLNVAVFRSDYKNLQVASSVYTIVAGSPILVNVVSNAGQSRAQGVEMDAQWKLSNSFKLVAAGTYLDSKYLNYVGAPATQLQQFQQVPFQDLSGRPTEFAPKISGNLTGIYNTRVTGNYKMTAQLTALYSSKYYSNVADDDYLYNEGYTRLDGRLTFESPDGKWAFDLIGKNLTDRLIAAATDGMPNSTGSRAIWKEMPRSIAAQIRYHW